MGYLVIPSPTGNILQLLFPFSCHPEYWERSYLDGSIGSTPLNFAQCLNHLFWQYVLSTALPSIILNTRRPKTQPSPYCPSYYATQPNVMLYGSPGVWPASHKARSLPSQTLTKNGPESCWLHPHSTYFWYCWPQYNLFGWARSDYLLLYGRVAQNVGIHLLFGDSCEYRVCWFLFIFHWGCKQQTK